jgi:hypothetical protein
MGYRHQPENTLMTFTLLACLAGCYAVDTDQTKSDCLAQLANPPALVWLDARNAVPSKGYAFYCTLETKTQKVAR